MRNYFQQLLRHSTVDAVTDESQTILATRIKVAFAEVQLGGSARAIYRLSVSVLKW
jgi:hypothetical protein